MNRLIYFDYNATTPLTRGARRDASVPQRVWGNPSSLHQLGQRARALLDEARDGAATVLGCKPSEPVFTSGGTESSNLAVLAQRGISNQRPHHHPRLNITPSSMLVITF